MKCSKYSRNMSALNFLNPTFKRWKTKMEKYWSKNAFLLAYFFPFIIAFVDVTIKMKLDIAVLGCYVA